MSPSVIFLLIGAALMSISAWFGMRFYPPGYGYSEERRNNRIAGICIIASACAFLVAFILMLPQ